MSSDDPNSPEPTPEPPAPASPAPTSLDVARLARVSRATVSYVLNETPNKTIRDETKARVRAAAAQLGYVPHEMASSLRAGRNDLVLLPFFDLPYNQSSIAFLQLLALQVEALGYAVVLRLFRHSDKAATIRKIASFHPVGVIVPTRELEPEDVKVLSRNGVRTILAYGHGETLRAAAAIATIDFAPVGALAAEHFAALGHRRLAVIMPRDPRIVQIGERRLAGVTRVAQERGLDVERVDLDFDVGQAAALAARWRAGSRPTAVFTYNDEYGLLLLSALQDVGLSVPGDIALIGCDGLSIGELARPRLTTIVFDTEGHTARIAAHFDDLLQGRAHETSLDVSTQCRLVVRESA